MEYLDDVRKDMMGEFHNKVVTVIDESALTPTEVIVILRMIVSTSERLFELAVKAKKE